MKVKECDSELLKKIVNDWHDSVCRPHSIPQVSSFSFVDDETGERSDTYSLNTENPYVRSSMLRHESILKFIHEDSFEDVFSYSWRIECASRFVQQNREQLIKMDLVRNTETHQLIANVIYEAAALCKVGKRGFKFKDMMITISKIELLYPIPKLSET